MFKRHLFGGLFLLSLAFGWAGANQPETIAETAPETIPESIVVPEFGSRGEVPGEVLRSFMRDFRRELGRLTGLAINPGELVSPGLAASLDAGLFSSLLGDLGEGRYGISGEIAGPTVQADGREQFSVNVLVVDVVAGRSSDLLSRSFAAGRSLEAARSLATAVRDFIALPTAALPEGSASLFISSEPGEADVYVNGIYVGRTGSGLEPIAVVPGRYEIEWRKDGFLPFYDAVTAEAEHIEFIHAFLSPVSAGSIRLTSRPAARVYLGGRFVGTTPLTLPISPGQHSLRLERPGFISETYQVSVQRSRVSRIEAELRPLGMPLVFWEPPPGYLVYIDGLLRARPFVADLPSGQHLVELVSPEETQRFQIYLPSLGAYEIDFGAQRLVPLYGGSQP
jgi:hypothetical protein